MLDRVDAQRFEPARRNEFSGDCSALTPVASIQYRIPSLAGASFWRLDFDEAFITEALQEINLEQLATKSDLRDLENRLLKWIIPLMVGQTALCAAIVEWLTA